MPYIKMKNRVCKKCGSKGGLFYAQKRENRPTKLNVHFICQRCKREDVKDSYYKCSKVDRRYNITVENMYLMEVV